MSTECDSVFFSAHACKVIRRHEVFGRRKYGATQPVWWQFSTEEYEKWQGLERREEAALVVIRRRFTCVIRTQVDKSEKK